MKGQTLRDNSMASYFVSKKTMEINPKQSIILELTKNVAADKSDQTVQDLIWLLFDSWLFTSGFNLDGDPGDIDDGYEEKMCEEVKADFEPLTETTMEVLGDKTEEVMVSSRIADAPSVLSTSEQGRSANMERTMKGQTLRDNSMASYFVSKKTMEINPKQSISLELKKKAAADKSDQTVLDLIWLLFDSCSLTSGFNLDEDPGDEHAVRQRKV